MFLRTCCRLILPLLTTAAVQAQSTVRISVHSSGAEGSGTSDSGSISADGRFVAFTSTSADLVPGDTNGLADVFVHDRLTGTTTRVSVDSSGNQTTSGGSGYPSISGDGRHVVFLSASSTLVQNDTNLRADVFVHDRTSALTTRVSVDSNGVEANLESGVPRISADGRFVAFESRAANLVPGDTNAHWDIFVRDLVLGSTTRASVSSSGAQAGHQSFEPSLSADGRFVAFWSYAPDLVAGDTNGVFDVFVRDLATSQTSRVSVATSGVQGNGYSGPGSISADGRRVVFSSTASNFFAGDAGFIDVFVHDRWTGETVHESQSLFGGNSNGNSFAGTLSADGRFVTFVSLASDLVGGDTNGASDVFLRDRQSGTTFRASVASNGAQADFASVAPFTASISADGRALAFRSAATNLVAGDTNGLEDVFVRDVGFDPGVVECSGDAGASSCPCGNAGSTWHGCAHSFAASGARLSSSGLASVASDSFLLVGASLPSTTSVLFFQGTARVNGSAGVAFGDGLRCAGGNVRRLGTRSATGGASSYGAPAGDAPISVAGAIPASGGTFHYQAWFRNAAPFCTSGVFNLTNGLRIAWSP